MGNLIGTRLGSIRLLHLLGQGGMASVYYGLDEALQRPVAVKVLGEQFQDQPAFAERFVREARAVASWRHPNIPQVYGAGREDGHSYFVMEYIHGMDLAALLRQYRARRERIPPADVVRIGQAVADALDYAHERGAVHRDVKPSNVLVAEDGRILLTDFGLVLQASLGTLGEVFGSPHYIAPEQARSSAAATPQSDLYSLGVMLYEMLTGALPFDDPSPTSLALMHLTAEPPAPRTLNPDLSAETEAVLLRALSKTPAERYRSGQELMTALERSLPAALKPEDTRPRATQPGPPVTQVVSRHTSLNQPPNTRPTPAAAPAPPPTWQATIAPGRPGAGRPADGRPAAGLPAAERPPRIDPRAASVGCGLLLALTLLAVFAGWLAFAGRPGAGRPGAGLPGAGLPADGRLSSATPATATTAALLPATATPSPTAEPSPTATLEPSPTATLTETPAPSPTPLPPSPTLPPTATLPALPLPALPPTPNTPGFLRILRFSDNSLILFNGGTRDLPLALMRFESGKNELDAAAWEVERLEPGQCVAIWKPPRQPALPEGLSCQLVGQALQLNGNERLQNETIDVFLRRLELGRCTFQGDVCDWTFSRLEILVPNSPS